MAKHILVLYPTNLGDGIVYSPLLDFLIRTRDTKVTVVTSESLKYVLSAKKPGLHNIISFEDALPTDSYDWLLDFISTQHSFQYAITVTTTMRVFHDTSNHICIEGPGGLLMDRFPDPVFNPEYGGTGALPDLPAWAAEAPLVSYALGESFWDRVGDVQIEPFLSSTKASSHNRNIVFIPCGAWLAKHWPTYQWNQLAIEGRQAGWDITWVFGPSECGSPVREYISKDNALISPDIEALCATLEEADLVIGHDCGPIHLAAAMVVPTIAIFGPTNPRRWFCYRSRKRLAIQEGRPDPWENFDRALPWQCWPSANVVYAAAASLLSSSTGK